MEVLFPIIFIIIAVLLFSLIIKNLWAYLVVRLFPGAVEQNLIAKEISWKIAIIFAIITVMFSSN